MDYFFTVFQSVDKRLNRIDRCTELLRAINLGLTNRKYIGEASVFLTKEGEQPRATIKQKQRCCSEYRMSEANPAIICKEIFDRVQPLMTRK